MLNVETKSVVTMKWKLMMKQAFLKTFVAGVFLIGLSGCSQVISNSQAEPAKSDDARNDLEAIYGFSATANTLQFTVKSTGCTQSEHFALRLTEETLGHFSAALIRNKADRCKAMPRMFPVKMTLDKPLNHSARVEVKNPFAVKISRK